MGERPAWVPSWAARWWSAPLSSAIVVSWIVLFVIAAQAPLIDNARLLELGAASRATVREAPWRLITSSFAHLGFVALLWNAFFGLRWMAIAEGRLGKPKFLTFYLGAAITSTAAALLARDVVVSGASGAIFGIIGDSFVRWGIELGSFKKFLADRNIRATALIAALWLGFGSFAAFDPLLGLGGLAFGALVGAIAGLAKKQRAPKTP
jgi:rhomboid protease GluP